MPIQELNIETAKSGALYPMIDKVVLYLPRLLSYDFENDDIYREFKKLFKSKDVIYVSKMCGGFKGEYYLSSTDNLLFQIDNMCLPPKKFKNHTVSAIITFNINRYIGHDSLMRLTPQRNKLHRAREYEDRVKIITADATDNYLNNKVRKLYDNDNPIHNFDVFIKLLKKIIDEKINKVKEALIKSTKSSSCIKIHTSWDDWIIKSIEYNYDYSIKTPLSFVNTISNKLKAHSLKCQNRFYQLKKNLVATDINSSAFTIPLKFRGGCDFVAYTKSDIENIVRFEIRFKKSIRTQLSKNINKYISSPSSFYSISACVNIAMLEANKMMKVLLSKISNYIDTPRYNYEDNFFAIGSIKKVCKATVAIENFMELLAGSGRVCVPKSINLSPFISKRRLYCEKLVEIGVLEKNNTVYRRLNKLNCLNLDTYSLSQRYRPYFNFANY